MKRFTVLLFVVFLLFPLSACGGGEEEPTAAPSPTQAPAQAAPAAQPTATDVAAPPTAAAPVVDAPGAPSLAEDAFGQLSSYRSNITWSVSNGGNITQQVTMNIAETAQPNARQINMTSNEGEFAIVQIEDTLYVNVGGMWQQLPAAGAAAMMGQLIFTPEDLTDMATGSDATFDFIGTEQVNGIWY